MSLVYYTATTLDGFIATTDDSLAWLMRQDLDAEGAQHYGDFIERIGASVMGSTTYLWVLDHLEQSGDAWFYDMPPWVMNSRAQLPVLEGADVRFASGSAVEVYDALRAAAGDKDVWVVGGGDLAGQFAEAGLLDELIVSIAPVTLGAGRPLLPRPLDLRLVETAANGAFVTARYEVLGPLQDE